MSPIPGPLVDEQTGAIILGTLDQILAELRNIDRTLRKPEEWGAVSEIYNATWAANASDEYQYDGTFRSVAIFNRSASTVRVGFAPGTGGRAGLEEIDLAARAWIVLPIRGSFVSIGGTNAGTATILAFSTVQNVAAGVF